MLSQSYEKYWLRNMSAIVVVAAIVATGCLVVEAKLPYRIALEGATYMIKSEVITAHETIRLEEFHSNHQRRSRVNYQLSSKSKPPSGFSDWFGSFIADDREVLEVYIDCKATDHAAVGRALQIGTLDTSDKSSLHVIGVARLLIDIETRSEKFEPAQLEGKQSADTYEAEMGQYKVTVYYKDRRVLGLGVPSAIHVLNRDSSQSTIVRPKIVTPLKSDEIILTGSVLSGAQKPSSGANDLLFDVFAIDRTSACAKHLTNLYDIVANKYRFSFKAHLLAAGMRPVELVVGYEPMLETLRVDHSYGAKWSQTITNFRYDRRYNVVRRVTGGEGHRPYDDFFDARHANDVSCAVTRAGSIGVSKGLDGNTHTLGRMLYGARQIAYLGMARVRGVDAYMYAAYDSRLPVWLDVPSNYVTQRGTRELRDGRLGDMESARKLTTVLYFDGPLPLADRKLLLIEIFESNYIDLYKIPIYQFSSNIQPTGPNGKRWEDFFSLSDVCLAPSTGSNHYARFNLQLKVAGPDNSSQARADLVGSEWIRESAKRNVALIKAIDDQFKVPPTLVYDLESRFRGPLENSNEMVVSLMMAERKRQPIMVKYLARSKEPRGEYNIEQVISFQNCLELAAHRQADTLFAYSDYRRRCYIYTGKWTPAESKSSKIPFSIDTMGQFEVYQTEHDAESKLARDAYLAKLDETRARMINNGRIFLDDPSVKVLRPSVNFRLMGVNVEHLNEKVAYDLDDHHLEDVNKFPGLGLVEDDAQNKLVEPKQALDSAPITFEQCQEACLIDLECEAYSTCIVNGKIQCLLSGVDFKVPTTVIELILLRDKKSELGEVIEIKLAAGGEPEVSAQTKEQSTIRIKKHPTCELHNKLYRDIFTPAGLSKVNLKGRLLRPVAHEEQCAEFCFLGTVATMRKEMRRSHKTIYDKDDPGLTEGYSASHCGHYFFLDQQKLASSKVDIPAEQIIGTNTDGPTRGYCVFDDGTAGGLPASEKKELTNKWLIFELPRFNLDFSVLYEKSYGISLVSSMKTSDEQSAYARLLLGGQDYTSEHLDIMRKFIQAGGNTARMGPSWGVQDCARRCFTQTFGLWPACRSFDVVQLTVGETATKMTVCVYSTSTVRELRQLGRDDLIRENNAQSYLLPQAGDDVQVWHYEPRLGLVASSVEQQYQIGIEQSESLIEQMIRKASGRLHLGTFGLLLTICIVIAAGLGLGMRASSSPRVEQLMSRAGLLLGRPRGDEKTLVDDADDL